MGHPPAPVSRIKKEQRASGSFSAQGPLAPCRGNPTLIPVSQPSLVHHQSQNLGITWWQNQLPLLHGLRETSLLSPKGNHMCNLRLTTGIQPMRHRTSVPVLPMGHWPMQWLYWNRWGFPWHWVLPPIAPTWSFPGGTLPLLLAQHQTPTLVPTLVGHR